MVVIEDLSVQEVAPVVVLERPHRGVDAQAGGPVEMAAGAGPQMLDAPAMVGADQVVSLQGGFIGIQRQVDREVAIGVQCHLPAGRRAPVQDRVKLGPGVVH